MTIRAEGREKERKKEREREEEREREREEREKKRKDSLTRQMAEMDPIQDQKRCRSRLNGRATPRSIHGVPRS